MKSIRLIMPLIAAMTLNITASADTVLDEAAAFVKNAVPAPSIGTIGGEWAVLGLARSGADVDEKYFDDYYARVEAYTSEHGGVLDERKYTEYSRAAIAITSIGRDPQNVGGYNLLIPLADFNETVRQGINGSVFALIAFDCGDYEIPHNSGAEVQATREMYVENILSRQNEDVGFSLIKGGESEVDMTAMAVTALSEYTSIAEVSEAVDRSVSYLSAQQLASGGFGGAGSENLESSAQVMVAMTSLGISAEDERFVKNGNSVYDNILSFKRADGFSHEVNGAADEMSNEQALYAIAAYERAKAGKNKLYDMSDVVFKNSGTDYSGDKETLKPVNEGISFGDIDEAHGKTEIEALAKYGVINGKVENVFAPEDSMTRAEFAAIVVRGLGYGTEEISQSRTERFSDVRAADWFAGYVGLAARSGIINGVSETEFNPNGTITREQAAVMVSSAMMVGGIGSTSVSGEAEIRDMLSQFGDCNKVSDWAEEGLTVCYREGILSQEELSIEPQRAIMRFEVARMVYNMALKGELISD